MDKIDRLSQMMGVLRRRVLDASKRSTTATPKPDSGETPRVDPGRSLEALRGRIRERIQALPPEEATPEGGAARVFVESVLVWEFGEAMLDDPQFASLVERIDQQVASDEGLRRQFRSLLHELAG